MREYAETAGNADPLAASLRDRIVPGVLAERGLVPAGLKRPPIKPQWHPDEADVGAFAHLLLHRSERAAEECFAGFLNQGALATTLFTELLSRTARLLGEKWLKDECSFVDVTLGMTILHRLLHRHSGQLDSEVPQTVEDRAILITPIPGEDHIFAAALLLEFFRSARWRVFSGIGEGVNAVIRHAEKERVDVIGVTVSAVTKLDDCRRLIGEFRDRKLNADMKILVGGPPFAADPRAYRDVGADAMAGDPLAALDTAAGMTGASKGKVS